MLIGLPLSLSSSMSGSLKSQAITHGLLCSSTTLDKFSHKTHLPVLIGLAYIGVKIQDNLEESTLTSIIAPFLGPLCPAFLRVTIIHGPYMSLSVSIPPPLDVPLPKVVLSVACILYVPTSQFS